MFSGSTFILLFLFFTSLRRCHSPGSLTQFFDFFCASVWFGRCSNFISVFVVLSFVLSFEPQSGYSQPLCQAHKLSLSLCVCFLFYFVSLMHHVLHVQFWILSSESCIGSTLCLPHASFLTDASFIWMMLAKKPKKYYLLHWDNVFLFLFPKQLNAVWFNNLF